MLAARDHRLLGQKLDLFHMQEEAPGMVFWHPRGHVVYRALEEVVRRQIRRDGFQEVRTPQILRRPVWEKSGHWQSFAQDMFLLEEDVPAAIKPVSCPGHLQLVKHRVLSHRDLPLRLAEFGVVHRNEPSGSLHGLFRLRQFTQDDGHIFCRIEDVVEEVSRFARGLIQFYAALGFAHVEVAFSSRPAKRTGEDAVWDRAESLLREAGERAGFQLAEQPGQGAFYGPKLEFALRDALGRQWQCGTIQLDLVLPERFDVAYVDGDGVRQRPALLHRAILGSLERFLGVLLEQHDGALPAWLAPEQVRVLPVDPSHAEAASALGRRVLEAGLRVHVDNRRESLARRIHDAHQDRVPFVAVLGAKEAESGTVSLREREGQRAVDAEAFLEHVGAKCQAPIG